MSEYSKPASAIIKTTVSASAEACFKVASELEHYPTWVDGIELVDIKQTDDQGRPLICFFNAESFGRKISYTLQYDYSEAPNKMSWTLLEGDLISSLEGSYEFLPTESEDTEIVYTLAIDLSVPLPGFVKRRAEDKVLEGALADFKKRIESI